jgi:uncharacterized membrane protein YgcG
MPITHKILRCGAIFVLSAVGGPALAQSQGVTGDSTRVDGQQPSVAAQLAEQGYEVVETGRTLLGRVRIVAERDGQIREVVVSRSTGEVMRDAMLGEASEASGETTRFGITSGEGDSGGGGGNSGGGGGGNPGSADG